MTEKTGMNSISCWIIPAFLLAVCITGTAYSILC